jgi:hypothetical protein
MTTVGTSDAAIGARASRARAKHIEMRGGEGSFMRNTLRRVKPVVVYMSRIAT